MSFVLTVYKFTQDIHFDIVVVLKNVIWIHKLLNALGFISNKLIYGESMIWCLRTSMHGTILTACFKMTIYIQVSI